MEKYNKILDQIAREAAQIKKKEAQIEALEYEQERKNALDQYDKTKDKKYLELYKDLHKGAENNAGAIAKISKSIFIQEIKIRILKENARASLFADGWKAVSEALRPYDGKQYGEKTAEKIRDQVKAAGYYFYFKGGIYSEKTRIEISPVPECPTHYRMIEASGCAVDQAGHSIEFIDRCNTIHATVDVAGYDHYIEDVNARAKEIYKAIHVYQEALSKAKAAGSALAAIIPDGIPRPEYINDYYVRF